MCREFLFSGSLLPAPASFSCLTEKLLHQLPAFQLQNAALDLDIVKHPLETGHIQRGTASAAARVAEPVDNTVHTRIHHRAGTHGAGFLRHENRDTVHPPVAYGIRGGGQYQNLGVRRRIFQHFNLIPRLCNHHAVFDRNSPHGDFAIRA